MAASFSRFLSSGVWELTAEAGKRYLVHKDVLTSQSQRLRDIIDAFTAAEPSPKREIPLDNWDADTVGRFVEYVYTGDYQSPDPLAPSTPAMTPTESVQGADSEESLVDATPGSSPKQAQGQEDLVLTPPARPLTPLSKCFPPGPDPLRKLSAAETFAEKYFDPSEHDFEEVFLAHAKVFALAQEFEMHDLQTLAVQRLLRTFINIGSLQPDWPVALNFVELVRYAYGGNNSSNNDLRHVVSQFAALNFTALQMEEMKVLIEQSGRFARDLTAKVCRRLIVAEKSQDNERKELKELKLQMHAMKAELEEELEKVVGKSASLSRSINLLDRKSSGNSGSTFGSFRKPALPKSSNIFSSIPPPPPNRTFPGTNTFGTITGFASTSSLSTPTASATANIFGNITTPTTTTSSFCRSKKTPVGDGGLFAPSQPGGKSIFVKTGAPTSTPSLFAGPDKSIFEAIKAPEKSSSSFGLFDTPTQSRSTSALGMVGPAETVGLFSQQPAPPSGLFSSSCPPNNTSGFGTVKQTEAAGNLFRRTKQTGSQFLGTKVAPTAPLFGEAKTAPITPLFRTGTATLAPLPGQSSTIFSLGSGPLGQVNVSITCDAVDTGLICDVSYKTVPHHK